ncbi:MAG: hypothetical protein FJX74_13785 [Armatimonadetes bacterium]|nr:hypothetical protein [Armatimonadota bacterium]
MRLSAELWSARNGQSVIYGERCLASPDAGSPRLPWQYGEPLPWGALATARPDLAASILEGLVRQVEYVPGPSSAERPALIAKLQRDLAALEATELALLDEAAASGVMIQHRPEVAAARADEAERRRREQEAATARQAREAAIDRQHAEAAGRGRAVRSAYVESGRVDRSPK